MRKLSIRLFSLAFIAAALWSGYWYVGARATERALTAWLDARRAEGWTAEARSLATSGFPGRFDTDISGLALADPDTEVGWSAPEFQLLSLAYKPHHLIAIWPGEQVVSLPDQSVGTIAETLRGSFLLAPKPSLPLNAATIEIAGATFTSTKGWVAALDHGQLALRQTPGAEAANSYDIALSIADLAPSDTFLARLNTAANLPETVQNLTLAATVTFDAPWDRYAIERARPQPRQIALDNAEADWGALHFAANGTLEVDTAGSPTGEIAIEASNWRDMIVVAEASGALSAELAGPVTRALEIIAGLNGDPEVLNATLAFRNGLAFLGPVPIGPAPVIALP